MNTPAGFSPVSRAVIVTAAIAIATIFLKMAASFVAPILLAAFIAVIVAPPLRWLMRKRVPKWLAMAIVIILLIEVGGMFTLIFTGQLEAFSEGLPSLQERFALLRDNFGDRLEDMGVTNARDALDDIFDPAVLVSLVRVTLSNISGIFGTGLLILLAVVFMLLESSGLPAKLKAAYNITGEGEARLRKVTGAINRYMVIKSVASLATAVIIYIWLQIFGLQYTMLLAILAFLLNYIPFVGAILMMIPAVLLALIQTDLPTTLLVALGYVFANTLIGNILEPRIMGRGLGISTLAVFFSLLFWGWVLGTVGVFLATPLTIALIIALDASPHTRPLAIMLGPEVTERAEPAEEQLEAYDRQEGEQDEHH